MKSLTINKPNGRERTGADLRWRQWCVKDNQPRMQYEHMAVPVYLLLKKEGK